MLNQMHPEQRLLRVAMDAGHDACASDTESHMIDDHHISPITHHEADALVAIRKAMDDPRRNKLHTKEFFQSVVDSLDVEDEEATA